MLLQMIDLGGLIPPLLMEAAHVTGVELRGSRARGDAGRYSDWDFVVWSDNVAATARELPDVVRRLHPLLQQWDRLSAVPCYMLMLSGPTKVDLIFEGHAYQVKPPWQVSAATLPGIDAHFWDWTLWLGSKVDARKSSFVEAEFRKMFDHLLGPLGACSPPDRLAGAIDVYLRLRDEQQMRLGIDIDPEPGRQVRRALMELTDS